MTRLPRTAALLLAASLLGACTHIQYFADSDHELITSTSIQQQVPTPVRVEAKFMRDGKEVPRASQSLKRYVIEAMNVTSVLRPTDDPKATSVLHVEVEDFAASGEQPNGDFLFSGMTHGAVPVSRLTDHYEFKLRYRMPNGHQRFGHDQHGIWTKLGDKPAPSLRGPFQTSDRAFRAVVADVVLTFLKNVTQTGDDADSVIFVPDDTP